MCNISTNSQIIYITNAKQPNSSKVDSVAIKTRSAYSKTNTHFKIGLTVMEMSHISLT